MCCVVGKYAHLRRSSLPKRKIRISSPPPRPLLRDGEPLRLFVAFFSNVPNRTPLFSILFARILSRAAVCVCVCELDAYTVAKPVVGEKCEDIYIPRALSGAAVPRMLAVARVTARCPVRVSSGVLIGSYIKGLLLHQKSPIWTANIECSGGRHWHSASFELSLSLEVVFTLFALSPLHPRVSKWNSEFQIDTVTQRVTLFVHRECLYEWVVLLLLPKLTLFRRSRERVSAVPPRFGKRSRVFSLSQDSRGRRVRTACELLHSCPKFESCVLLLRKKQVATEAPVRLAAVQLAAQLAQCDRDWLREIGVETLTATRFDASQAVADTARAAAAQLAGKARQQERRIERLAKRTVLLLLKKKKKNFLFPSPYMFGKNHTLCVRLEFFARSRLSARVILAAHQAAISHRAASCDEEWLRDALDCFSGELAADAADASAVALDALKPRSSLQRYVQDTSKDTSTRPPKAREDSKLGPGIAHRHSFRDPCVWDTKPRRPHPASWILMPDTHCREFFDF